MSRDDLHTLFTELADDITNAPPVEWAVAGAIRIRRRRRALLGSAIAVVLIAAAGAVWWFPAGGRPAPFGPPNDDGSLSASGPASAASAPSGPPSSTREPGRARIDRLPATLTTQPGRLQFWPDTSGPPAGVSPGTLTAAPLSHAVLLQAPSVMDSGATVPIYAYGEGAANGGSGNGAFHWVRVAVDLGLTRDAAGNGATPLDPNSLGPMGLKAAFPQPDFLVIVDLVTGAVRRIPVAGFNRSVSWLADGRHVLVSGGARNWLVDVETRSVVPAAARVSAVTPLVGGGTGLTTLSLGDARGAPPVVRSYDDGGLVERGQVTVDTNTVAPYRISGLTARGWRMGDRIAQAASGSSDPGSSGDSGSSGGSGSGSPGGSGSGGSGGTGSSGGSARRSLVAVIDARTGAITHLLDLGTNRTERCCDVLGWANGDDILVRTDREGLVKWHLPDGSVTRLGGRTNGVDISVGPTGCGWTITVGDVTAACRT